MKHGGFQSRSLLDDALTIAIDRVRRRRCGPSTPTASRRRSGSGRAVAGEALEGRPGELPPGTLVVADARAAGRRFCSGPVPAGAGSTPKSRSGRCWSRSRSAECRRSRSRRRCGWPPGCSRVRIRRARSAVARSCSSTPKRTPRRPRPPSSRPGPAPASAARAATCGGRSRGSSASSASCSPRPSRAAGSSGASGAVGGPRMLSTGELERVRDALAARLARRQGGARRGGPTSRRPTAAWSSG